jgi:hypothetical protein
MKNFAEDVELSQNSQVIVLRRKKNVAWKMSHHKFFGKRAVAIT